MASRTWISGWFSGLAKVALAALVLAVWVAPSTSSAQQNAIKLLEEEVNLLKETIEQNNRSIRKLREGLKNAEAKITEREKALDGIRNRLTRIDVLRKEIQTLEAKMNELAAGGGGGGGGQGNGFAIKADIRIRPELTLNRTDLNNDTDDVDGYWGHRARFGAEYGFDGWVHARLQLQEARTFGSTVAQTGELGLHQAFIELKPTVLPGLIIRGGRTDLSFGAERLVGRDDFSFTGRAFDGGYIRWGRLPYFDGRLFYAKVRESNLGEDGDKDFFGAYLRTEAVPYVPEIELYYMGLLDKFQRDEILGDETVTRDIQNEIHTVGARIVALAYGLRIEGEAIVQFGKRTDPADSTKELDHFANAFFAELSYQIPVATLPTLGVAFAYASGDANPTDSKSIDFQPLFPTRHSFLGTMDLFSWSNIMDISAHLELTPPMGFGFFAGVHYFRLVQKHGRLFGLGGGKTPAGQNIGNNVGLEIDVAASWAPNEHLQLQGGYSIFLPQTVPEQLQIGTDAAHWAYIQARVIY